MRAGSQSFPLKVPWLWAELRLQDPSRQQAHTHLETPHGASGVSLPNHLPGGQTGPSCLLPPWVQLPRPLLGLLFVLWDPESHKYKESVGISRHSPFPNSDRSSEPDPTSTSSSWVPCLQPRWQMHSGAWIEPGRGHSHTCLTAHRDAGLGQKDWSKWGWAARRGNLLGSGSTSLTNHPFT